jgi:plasmid stabilization system protein ParE
MKIKILPSAMKDLERGRNFYEQQGEGLGHYFMDSLLADIDSLALYGGIHSVHWGYHRLLSKRFPYAAYYMLKENIVEVWRVLDCRKNPKWTKRALPEQ